MAEPPPDPDRPSDKPKYLPRIIYQPPDSTSEGETSEGQAAPRPDRGERPKDSKSGGRAGKETSAKKPAGKEKKGVLIEETPDLDTYDSRRRVRLIVGVVAASLFAVGLFAVVRALQTGGTQAEEPTRNSAPAPIAKAPKESPASREARAEQLLADARGYERTGKMDLALDRIARIIGESGDGPSAKLARAARERHERGLPLFVDGPAVVADKPEPKAEVVEPPPEAPEPPIVAAVRPVAPPPVGTASVEVAPPTAAAGVALAEPRRPTGIGLPKSDVPARPLPPGFRARPEAGVHASGWPLEITCDKDGATMVLVPGGTFTQGRDDGKPEERPAHKVILSTYYIDQHETTANQFRRFQGDHATSGDTPAVQVSLADARAYAQWSGKSLPTEAQWEMAARTPDGRVHPWGNSPASWDRARLPKQIDPVMSFGNDLSPYGAFDLAGNAWEWTNDWFDTKSYASLKGRVPSNPAGPAQGKGRIPEVVIKGGSKDWDGSWRSGMRPEARLPYLGFRCVLNVEAGGAAAPLGGSGPANLPAGNIPF